jgi:hypothetical protein
MMISMMMLFFAEINENFLGVDGMNEKYQKLFEKMVKFFKPGDVMSELAANGNTISCEIQKT